MEHCMEYMSPRKPLRSINNINITEGGHRVVDTLSRAARPLFSVFLCSGGKKGLVWFAVTSRLSNLDTFGSVK